YRKYLMLALSIAAFAQAGPQLYQKEYDEKPSNGKPLRIAIREVERGDLTSRLVVEFSSGASVPSAMAVARAAYDIAKDRKKCFFINLKEWEDEEGKWNYIIGFTNKKEPSPLSF